MEYNYCKCGQYCRYWHEFSRSMCVRKYHEENTKLQKEIEVLKNEIDEKTQTIKSFETDIEDLIRS